jgi:hypothetical protein
MEENKTKQKKKHSWVLTLSGGRTFLPRQVFYRAPVRFKKTVKKARNTCRGHSLGK